MSTPDLLTIRLKDESATVRLGESLGRAAAGGAIVFLQGTLGAGKTTLCRGVLRAFGHQGAVKSPTYTLVEAYEFPSRHIYHFDLYRLGDPEELEYMGIRDYFSPDNLCLIEWPERGAGFLPAADLEVKVSVARPADTGPADQENPAQGETGSPPRTERKAQIIAHTATGQAVLKALRAETE